MGSGTQTTQRIVGAIKQDQKHAVRSRFRRTRKQLQALFWMCYISWANLSSRLAGTTSTELRREGEANAVNLGVCMRFFTEAKDVAENYQKVKFLLYGIGGGRRL